MLREAILEYGTVGAFHCKDIYDLKGTCKPEDVHTFECQVDTTESSISFVGDRFPNLRKLKLNNSIIPNMRDIGCRFTNLRFLSLARCGITSLNGISTISQVLEELYLAFNQIDDCSELVGMDSLIVIDLEENNISDLSNIEFLSTCSNLQSLTLSGNPCVDDPETYRTKVRDLLPKLRYLDEKRLQPKEERPNPRRARIRNEITYKKMKPKEPEPENTQPNEPVKIQSTKAETEQLPPKESTQSNQTETEKPQTKAKSKSQTNQTEKVQQKTNEKEELKESETTKIQSKSKPKAQSKQQKAEEKAQPKQTEKVQQKTNEKVESKDTVKEKAQSKPKTKTQSEQTEKNQSKQSEKAQQKTKEKTQAKDSDSSNIKNQPKAKEKEKNQSSTKSKGEENQPKEPQSSKSSKKVQIHEPPPPTSDSPSYPITEPQNPPQSSKAKEPQYENDDEVIITEMLDDLIEARPPTARGNYESKFFKDSFELQQRNKTPVILKAKPHVITPRIPRNKRPRAISSIKKLD